MDERRGHHRGGDRSDRSALNGEFGATCAFLCSVHAGYIKGQNILIDGARTL